MHKYAEQNTNVKTEIKVVARVLRTKRSLD